MHLSSNMENHIRPLLQRKTYEELNSFCSIATCGQSVLLVEIWEATRQNETGFPSNEKTDILLQVVWDSNPNPNPNPT